MYSDKRGAPVKTRGAQVDSITCATGDDSKLDALHTRIVELEREIAILRGSEARARVLSELIQRFTISKNTKNSLRSLFQLTHIFKRSDRTPLDEWQRVVRKSHLF